MGSMLNHDRDLQIMAAFCPVDIDEDPGRSGIQIEENYLERERRENAEEAGITDVLERTAAEIAVQDVADAYFLKEKTQDLVEKGELDLEDDTRGRSSIEKQLFINQGNHTRLHDDRRSMTYLPLCMKEWEKKKLPVTYLNDIDELGYDIEREDREEAEEREPLRFIDVA